MKIDQVYIGSCTGGKTKDFLAAAKVFLALVRSLNYPTMVAYNLDHFIYTHVLDDFVISIVYFETFRYTDHNHVVASGFLILFCCLWFSHVIMLHRYQCST